MARTTTPLSDTKCESAKPKDKEFALFDGQGLYLLVKPSGVKVWRFKYRRPDGRSGLATFGHYPALSLKAARIKRAHYLEHLAGGIDPMNQAREVAQIAASRSDAGFKAVALAWHGVQSKKWSEGHAAAVMRRIERYLLPALGQKEVTDLKTRALLVPLKQLESEGSLETANRLRQYLTGIMRYAVQHGFIESNPAADLLGATASGKVQHRSALPFERLPELLARIGADNGRLITRLAVQLSLLVFVRSSELRMARWKEVDLDRALWAIPAEREPIEGVRFSGRGSKMRTPHLVPLSLQAVAALRQLHDLTGGFDLLFAGDHESHKPMSENTINKTLRRMGYDTKSELCGHGFRSMACSALMESGLFTKDAVERQMSHAERNGVRAAYIHKAEHLEERRLMMQWWADYLDANRQSHISPFEFARPESADPKVVRLARA